MTPHGQTEVVRDLCQFRHPGLGLTPIYFRFLFPLSIRRMRRINSLSAIVQMFDTYQKIPASQRSSLGIVLI
jgi:hypothetical protein